MTWLFRLICMLIVRSSMARSLVVAVLKSRSAAGSLLSNFMAEARTLRIDSSASAASSDKDALTTLGSDCIILGKVLLLSWSRR